MLTLLLKNTNESLSRKVQLLEEELETNDANLRETTEKYVESFAIDKSEVLTRILLG